MWQLADGPHKITVGLQKKVYQRNMESKCIAMKFS
jgi:hypothetical protein